MTGDLKNLDVVIVSTVRPDILKITLNSFTNKMLHNFKVRAIINVDPVGEVDRYSQLDMVKICEQYFDVVVSNRPAEASFSAAVQWCWSQVETDIFFHLEDDWLLTKEIETQDMLTLFEDDNVVSIIFNKRGKPRPGTTAAYNFPKANHSALTNKYIRRFELSLNPGFFRTRYIRELLTSFDVSQDPERQFAEKKNVTSYSPPVFLRYVSKRRLVIDTGTKWKKARDFSKSGNRPGVTWRGRNTNKFKQANYKIRYSIALFYWRKRYCHDLKLPPRAS